MIEHRSDSVQRGLSVLDPMNDDESPQKRSRCRLVFFIDTMRHDLQPIIRQGRCNASASSHGARIHT
jgi:hypothetical protein